MRGYCAVSPLQSAELDALPAAILAYNVLEASYNQSILSGLLERRLLLVHEEVLDDTVETVRWRLGHDQAVVAAVGAGADSN